MIQSDVQNIFKRVEQKYLLTKVEYDSIQSLIQEHFLKDTYYENKIYNIYFDNDNDDIVINSLEKPMYKTKIRVRSYGIAKDNDLVYLEMKVKYNGTVYKRRVVLTLMEYNNYINNHVFPYNNKQIMKEIDYYINYYKMYPKIVLAYDRLSYYDKDDINFRLMFDYNLRSRYANIRLCDDENDKLYFDHDKYIMEVKCLNGLPRWFTTYLSDNKIYPTSFSKIGSIYTKERGEEKC